MDQRRIQREISILRRLTHGSIIQLLEIVETEHFIFLVKELDTQRLACLTVWLTYGNVIQLLQHGFQHSHEAVAMQQRDQSFLPLLLQLLLLLLAIIIWQPALPCRPSPMLQSSRKLLSALYSIVSPAACMLLCLHITTLLHSFCKCPERAWSLQRSLTVCLISVGLSCVRLNLQSSSS